VHHLDVCQAEVRLLVPQVVEAMRTLHEAEFIDELIQQGKLKPSKEMAQRRC
jgi:hypothetical protein